MTNGVTDTEELIRLIGDDLGDIPSKNSVRHYRSNFKKYGADWLEAEKARRNQQYANNPEKGKEATRRWQANNPEVRNETSKRWDAENPAKRLLLACKARAKQRGHECTITVEDLRAMLAPMTCAVTGLQLTYEKTSESKTRPFAPSIDRIDNSSGYVLGNVRVVCCLYNLMRADHKDEDVLIVAKALVASLTCQQGEI